MYSQSWATKSGSGGIILPLPHGVMTNYLQGWQLIQLSQMAVGFNGSQKYDLSDIVEFQEVKGNMATPNLRFDTWVLPFLNVYGIAGYATGKLDVHMSKPFDFQTSTTTNGQYYGVGTMLTGAISGIFLANDYNINWTFNDKLDHPAAIFMTGLRAGPVFRFPHNNRMNVSVWGGFIYSHLNSKTDGSIHFSDVFPNAGTDLDQLETKLDNWYTDAYNNAQLPAKKEAIQAVYDRSKEAIAKIRPGGGCREHSVFDAKKFPATVQCCCGGSVADQRNLAITVGVPNFLATAKCCCFHSIIVSGLKEKRFSARNPDLTHFYQTLTV